MTKEEALFQYTLRLGDSNLILGHRLSEWCGFGPYLEEDIALTNIALDLVGQSRSFLAYAAKVEDKGRDEDDLAYFRKERDFLNILMAEQPNGDFGKTMMRQFLFDVFHFYFQEELQNSKDEELSSIAAKSIKEVTYHLRHSSEWMLRLGDGTKESHNRVQNALDDLWKFTGEMFEMNEVDEILIKEGIAPDLNAIKKKWDKKVKEVFEEATLKIPDNQWMMNGSREGKHTEHLGYILAELQHIPRTYPDAKW